MPFARQSPHAVTDLQGSASFASDSHYNVEARLTLELREANDNTSAVRSGTDGAAIKELHLLLTAPYFRQEAPS